MVQGSTHVLIIDDDPGVLFLHEIIIKESKLHPSPSSFFDARKALEWIQSLDQSESRILIFLDINMPFLNGWNFLDELYKSIYQAQIKVIMVTSSLDRRDREKSQNYEMVIDFWEKPMDEDQVIELIRNLGHWVEEQ